MRDVDEARQWRALFRMFTRRHLENELATAEGDASQTFAQIAALLAAGGLTVGFLFVLKHYFAMSNASYERRMASTWTDLEFLISLSMAVAAATTVVCWDSLFPDRRDCSFLHSLPVRMRTMFTARVASILALWAFAVFSVNVFTSIFYPFVLLPPGAGLYVWFPLAAIHAATIVAASSFAFFGMVGLGGVLINLLSYRQFRRASAYIQFGALAAVLAVFFLMPNIAHPERLVRNWETARFLPPFWFLALYKSMGGDNRPFVTALAGLAKWGLALAIVTTAVAYTAGYARHARKAIEEQDLAPRRGWSLASLCRPLFRTPVERAVSGFIIRTIGRNRRHRLGLAIFCTAGIAYISDGVAALLKVQKPGYWASPRPESAAVPLILSFFLLVGMRVMFSQPVELQANWVFRLTESDRRAEYLSGARKTMLLFAFPLALLPLPLYGGMWGWPAALRHALFVLLFQMLLIEMLLKEADRIPFTCSYLPGKSNLTITFGVYWALFGTLAAIVTRIETWLLYTRVEYAVAACAVCGWLAWLVRKRRIRERRLAAFLFDDRPPGPIQLRLT